jgi:hypothetical protein
MVSSSVVVRFTDGRSVDGDSLRQDLSADIFQRRAHYDLAGAFAQAAGTSADVEPVLHNLLASKSSLIRDIGAALFVFEHDRDAVKAICVAPAVAQVVAGFAPEAPVVQMAGLSEELVGRKIALVAVAKAIAHRLYRLRRKPLTAGKAVIRAWVDVTLKMYAEEAKEAQLRVYPFPLNRHRQKTFVSELTRKRIGWSYDGLPYPLLKIGNVLMAGRQRRPSAIAQFEHDAFVGFASEVVGAGAGPVYTSDEFEAGAVSAGPVFRAAGTHYVNSAHGVGFYCPLTAYSHFRYLTKSQKDFYRVHSPETQFLRRQTGNFVLERPPRQAGDEASIVFVHQDYESAGLPAETRAEKEIITRLDNIKLSGKVKKYIKIHPNADPQPIERYVRDCKVSLNGTDIGAGPCLFLTINSTAFYDLIDVGEFAVFKDYSFTPEIYLEGYYKSFNLDNLQQVINDWMRGEMINK